MGPASRDLVCRLDLMCSVGDRAIGRYRPSHDAVEVVDRAVFGTSVDTTHLVDLGDRRLHVTGFVNAPTSDECGVSIPHPWETEAGRRRSFGGKR